MRDDGIEFTCRDCGRRVIGFGMDAVPNDGLCASCLWIRRYLPPEDQAEVRERMGVPLKGEQT